MLVIIYTTRSNIVGCYFVTMKCTKILRILQSQALMSSEQDLQKIGGNIITAILRFM